MAQTMNPQEAAQKARQLLDARVEKVETVTSAARRLEEAQAALEEASKEYASAWAEAEKAGWAPSELRQFGLSDPTRKRPGRPRKAKPSTAKPAVPSTGTDSAGPVEEKRSA